jgi:predicted transcriptional regulator
MDQPLDLLKMTTQVVTSYVGNNSVSREELPALIQAVHQALSSEASGTSQAPIEPAKPAVPIKKSIGDDYIVCLEDGRRMKSLKRHLHSHGLTPEAYRNKWGLPRDYPMVAPAYALSRSELAKSMGLGQKGRGRGS